MASFWQQMATSVRLFKGVIYCCPKCHYLTCRKNDFLKHLETKKHFKQKWQQMATCDFFCPVHHLNVKCIYDETTSEFCCSSAKITTAYEKKSQFMLSCDFLCDFFSEHKPQRKSKSHQKSKTGRFHITCSDCNKTYRDRSGLYRHRKKHHYARVIPTKQGNDVQKLTNMVETLICENKELQTQLLEIAKTPRIVNNNVIQKNKFNIVSFLNTDCKDAYNLSEFVTGLDITIDDIEFIKNHGYLEGIQYSIVKTLANMEETKRPIHCTDPKRRQFYVKDNNAWDKDKSNVKINQALNMYNTNQLKTVIEWKKKETDNKHVDQEGLQNDLNSIVKEVTAMYQDNTGDKMRNRIIDSLGNVCLAPNDTKK